MSQITLTNTSAVNGANLNNVSSSPQMAFAMLQMELAKANKEQALAGIAEIQKSQQEKAELADFMNKAREYQASGIAGSRVTKDAGKPPYTSTEFNNYVEKKLGFSVPNSAGDKNDEKNKAEWNTLIAQMQTKMDTMGADIQTKMVVLQDMMGQYNAYMQGANSAISTANQTLSGLARGQ